MTESIEATDYIPSVNLDEVTKVIASYTAKSSAIAAIPVPFLDVAGSVYIQVQLIGKIAELHNVEVSEKGKLITTSIVSAVVGKMVTEATNSLAKSVSLGKMLSDSIVKAAISGFITTISGEVYDYHFRNGGSIETLSFSTYMDYLNEQLRTDRLSLESIGSSVFGSALSKVGLSK